MPRRLIFSALFVGMTMVVMIGGCGGCHEGPERTVLRGGTDHLPLRHDRLLRYRETENGVTANYTVRMVYAGGNRIRVYDLESECIQHPFSSLLSMDKKVYYETQQPLTAVTDQPHYRELWLDEDADEGANWDSEDTGTTTVFEGYEPVTVPAGAFPSCYKTITTVQPVYLDSLRAYHGRSEMDDATFDKLSARAGMVTIRWFAPDVGLVKEQIGDRSHVRELVAVEREGIGLDNPPKEETTPSDSGE